MTTSTSGPSATPDAQAAPETPTLAGDGPAEASAPASSGPTDSAAPAGDAPTLTASAPVAVSGDGAPAHATAAPSQTAPAPAANGHTRPAPAAVTVHEPVRRSGSRRKRLLLLFPIVLVILVVGGVLGYRYWYDATYFISTDNASVTGDLVQVGSLNAGRIVTAKVDVGRTVQAGQEIAVVAMPQDIGTTAQGTGPKLGVTGTTDSLVSVYAPLTGIVAARMGYVGGTVAAGQPIYALIDPAQVWVKANVEESSAWKLALGQAVDIHVDALNRDFAGRVEAITPASAATFSLLPSNNASGNFTKVTQYVPVKIAVDAGGTVLPLGTSVEVRIHVREPASSFPLPWQP
ncbi:MAG: efflux RND transporter periplasmic adaptor subunit [Chloroflexi bacterium]|nr:efflux RND transporter periplasmic adaptor subunit [Chloroflexota bacterium]